METEKKKPSEYLANFIANNKVSLIVLFVVIISGVFALGAVKIWQEKVIVSASIDAEAILDLKNKYSDETDETAKVELENNFLELIEETKTSNKNNYASYRAIYEEGMYYLSKEDNEKAIVAFEQFLTAKGDNILVPLGLHKLANLYELNEDKDNALKAFNTISDKYSAIYLDIDRINFNIARLYEDREDYDNAIDSYNKIISRIDNVSDINSTEWYKIAKNRILYLQNK